MQVCEWADTVECRPRRHNHHDDVTINLVPDGASALGSFRPQLTDRLLNVVAHQCDRVVPGGFENLAFAFAASRVHAHLARSGFEDEPARIEILSDALPPEDIAEKRPRCLSIVGVNQSTN